MIAAVEARFQKVAVIEETADKKLEALRDMMALREYVDEGPVGKRRLPRLSKADLAGIALTVSLPIARSGARNSMRGSFAVRAASASRRRRSSGRWSPMPR